MDGWNYFSYFTEIEEYFWKKRGAHLLVSPLDWAIMETWQKADIPLSAVLKGIDRAFQSYQRSRRGAGRPLKSLAYCTDAVIEAAEEEIEAAAGATPKTKKRADTGETFSRDELQKYLHLNASQLRQGAERLRESSGEFASRIEEIAGSVEKSVVLVETPGALDVEDLERRLTILDEKVQAALTTFAGEELLLRVRRELDGQLVSYRRKMRPEQLAQIERQFLQKRLLEEFRLPRLSLYYMA